MCDRHYRDQLVFRPCSVPGCDNRLHAKGVCVFHYVGSKRDWQVVYAKEKAGSGFYLNTRYKSCRLYHVGYYTKEEYATIKANKVVNSSGMKWNKVDRRFRTVERDVCDIEGCSVVSVSKGLCPKHYQQSKRPPVVLCASVGCNIKLKRDVYKKRGYCCSHYNQIKIGWFKRKKIKVVINCCVNGCDRVLHGKGYCNKHWRKYIFLATESGRESIKRSRRLTRKKNLTGLGRLRKSVSGGIRESLRGTKNSRGWESLVGYSLEDLRSHIESRFTVGMEWDNYGVFGWHLDHIVPQSVFNFKDTDDIDFKRCWSLENLQPLWWYDNVHKSDKLDSPFQPSLALTG